MEKEECNIANEALWISRTLESNNVQMANGRLLMKIGGVGCAACVAGVGDDDVDVGWRRCLHWHQL